MLELLADGPHEDWAQIQPPTRVTYNNSIEAGKAGGAGSNIARIIETEPLIRAIALLPVA